MPDYNARFRQPAKVTAPPLPRLSSLVTMVAMVVVVTGLYLAREVLIPSCEQNLLIIAARITSGRLDDEETKFARICATAEICHRHRMAVIPACAAWGAV